MERVGRDMWLERQSSWHSNSCCAQAWSVTPSVHDRQEKKCNLIASLRGRYSAASASTREATGTAQKESHFCDLNGVTFNRACHSCPFTGAELSGATISHLLEQLCEDSVWVRDYKEHAAYCATNLGLLKFYEKDCGRNCQFSSMYDC
jgi:hypothetical protein